jgi:hypothetical protein
LVNVCVERVVSKKSANGSFTALGGRDHIVDSFSCRVETGDGGACIVVDLLVFDQPAQSSAPILDISNHQIDLID